ncbi:MAG: hypothetical protein ACFE0O_06290 [Opitutales bacterium]
MSENQSVSGLMVRRFRRRAASLKYLAYLVLGLIGASLGGGVYLFVIAGEIAAKESLEAQRRLAVTLQETYEAFGPSSANAMGQFGDLLAAGLERTDDLDKLIIEIRDAATSLQHMSYQIADASEEGDFSGVAKELKQLLTDIQGDALFRLLDDAFQDFVVFSQNAARFSEHLVALTSQMNQSLQSELDTQVPLQESDATSILISTLSTRIGALLILVFLVQILVSLYRYNIRLAAFFDARADALELSPGMNASDVESLIRVLSPENVDFGKSPASPTQHAVDLARELLARERRDHRE